MKKQFYIIILFLFPCFIQAQNVGIGTLTPTEKLEIKNPVRSTLKISSAGFDDTTQLILSNRDIINQGTDFRMTASKEQGLFFSSTSNLIGNTRDSLLSILTGGNVGIGTKNPAYRLQVHNPSLSGPSYMNITNSSTGAATGNGLLLGMSLNTAKLHNLEYGNLELGTDNLTHVTIDPIGNVGLGNPSPASKLDVNGDMNLTGSIKANGVDGAANQVLMKNSSGNLAWGDMGEYKNFVSLISTGGGTWTVPANVTKILVEVWGAGGGGNVLAGGGGGGYIKGHFTVTPGLIVSYDVGIGGTSAVSASAVSGGSSSCSVGAVNISGTGGQGALYLAATNGQGGVGGAWTFTGGFENYMRMEGHPGESIKRNFSQYNATTFYEAGEAGKGGHAANTSNTGGLGQSYLYNTTGSVLIFRNGNLSKGLWPGGGGSSGIQYGVNLLAGGNGGNGLVVIHY